MYDRTVVTIAALLIAPAAMGEKPAPGPAPAVVYLYGEADLAKLKAANSDHYWRAERLIAAAAELCKPGTDEMYYARFDAKEISCESMLLKTSNPPKREIGFTLDDVRYVAVITISDAEARFWRVPADAVSPRAPASKLPE